MNERELDHVCGYHDPDLSVDCWMCDRYREERGGRRIIGCLGLLLLALWLTIFVVWVL